MKKRKRIILLSIVALFLLASCSENPNENLTINLGILMSDNTIIEDKTLETGDVILEDAMPNYLLIDNLFYIGRETYTVYDLSSIEYIGDIIKHYPINKLPLENYTANCGTETTEIYKVDNETYILKYDIDIELNGWQKRRIYLKMELEKGLYTKTIKLNDSLYMCHKVYDEYDLDNLEFLCKTEEQLPIEEFVTENLTSNFCPKGSKIYRLDDSTILVQYEENDMQAYAKGEVY